MRRVRLGVIGANARSGWASMAHMPAILATPEVELTAVCTTRRESAEEAARTFGARHAFVGHEALIACPEVEAVCVLVRVPAHYEPTMSALAAGKHVYCEWPLGATIAEAEGMAALARSRGLVSLIGLQARVSPAILTAKALVEHGYVGEVLAVHQSMFRASILERHSRDMWQHDVKLGANTSTIAFGHAIDTLRFLLGDPVEISAQISRQVDAWRATDTGECVDVTAPDNVIVAARLAGRAVVSIHVATIPWAPSGHRLEIYGREGTLVVTGPDLPQLTPDIALFGARGGNALQPLAIRDEFLPRDPNPGGFATNIAEMYRRFAHAIVEGEALEPGFDTALELHRIIEATRASATIGASVELDLLRPSRRQFAQAGNRKSLRLVEEEE